MTTSLGMLLVFAGLILLFVLWDLIFCGGARCRELTARVFEIVPGRYRGGRPPK